jgi:hypothetical protein
VAEPANKEARPSGLSGRLLYEDCQVGIFLSAALDQSFNSPFDYFSLCGTLPGSARSNASF